MSDKPSVVEALSAVMGDVQAVGKTGRNTQQNYSFRGIDDVVNAVGPALRKHSVVCLPRVLSKDYGSFSTRGGTTMHTCTLEVEFTFHGPAGDSLVCSAMGESADAGDKATSKAHSVAFRTALLQALCIPTDEPDPDSTSYERAAAPAAMTATQQSNIAAGLARLDETQSAELKTWWKAQRLPNKASLSHDQADEVLMRLDELKVQQEAMA